MKTCFVQGNDPLEVKIAIGFPHVPLEIMSLSSFSGEKNIPTTQFSEN